MSGFGDDDPEDGYDAGDPAPLRVRVLLRWAWSVLLEDAYHPGPRVLIRAEGCRQRAQALQESGELDAADVAAVALIVWALKELT
jgi:hypothetical protein